MNRTTKIVVVPVVGLLGICLLTAAIPVITLGAAGALVGQRTVTDPTQVAAIAAEVASYNLPADYSHQFASKLLGFTIVSCTPDGYPGHIYLMQFPRGLQLDQPAMERQLWQATNGRRGEDHSRFVVVGTRQVTIRGQAVTLQVGEGINSDDQRYRQFSGVFQGKGGQVLITVSAPATRWDPAAVDAFLASID